jgi:hypothetical protein
VQVIKWRIMTWIGYVANVGKGEAYKGFRYGNLRERAHWIDTGIDGKIILRWNFRKWDVEVWTGSSWLSIGRGGGQL